MLDDRVCASCQVMLPSGRSICPKCGRKVEPARTGLDFIDIPRKLYSVLIERFGPIGAGIIAGAISLLLFALFIGLVLMKTMSAP